MGQAELQSVHLSCGGDPRDVSGFMLEVVRREKGCLLSLSLALIRQFCTLMEQTMRCVG